MRHCRRKSFDGQGSKRTDARHGLQSPRDISLGCQRLDLASLRIDPDSLLANLLQHIPAFLARELGEIAIGIIDDFPDTPELGNTLRNNMAIFVKAGPKRVHKFGALVNKRSEEHTSELQSLMRISYAVFCLK